MYKNPKIQLLTASGHQLVDPYLIICVCPEGRKSNVYLDNETKILVHKGIEEMEKLLDYPFFFRCHRNCIINMIKISIIDHDYELLHLHCGTKIPVSKHRKNKLKQVISRFRNPSVGVGVIY